MVQQLGGPLVLGRAGSATCCRSLSPCGFVASRSVSPDQRRRREFGKHKGQDGPAGMSGQGVCPRSCGLYMQQGARLGPPGQIRRSDRSPSPGPRRTGCATGRAVHHQTVDQIERSTSPFDRICSHRTVVLPYAGAAMRVDRSRSPDGSNAHKAPRLPIPTAPVEFSVSTHGAGPSKGPLPPPFRPARFVEHFAGPCAHNGTPWTSSGPATTCAERHASRSPTNRPCILGETVPSPHPRARALQSIQMQGVPIAQNERSASCSRRHLASPSWQTPPSAQRSPMLVRRCISPTGPAQNAGCITSPARGQAAARGERCASPLCTRTNASLGTPAFVSDVCSVDLQPSAVSPQQAGAYPREVNQQSHVKEDAHGVKGGADIRVLTPTHSPRADLQDGAVLRVGDVVCRIMKPLGMGSFGAVWAAEDAVGKALAVKEIICNSHADLLNALFEGHLLRTLGGASPEAKDGGRAGAPEMCPSIPALCIGGHSCQRNARQLPALIACETTQLAVDQWRIRLVMTRIFGEPLDSFLKRCQDQHRRSTNAPALHSQCLQDAFAVARELLLQLAPAFEEISGVAFHRDVNAHNILIDMVSGLSPRFGLVDFGLAVDISCWQRDDDSSSIGSRPSRVGQDGACTWHHLDVGGDCRYWPVSAWVQFLLGWTELEGHPPLRFEYRTQLDLHSLGLTALQVLVDLLPPREWEPPAASRQCGEFVKDMGMRLIEEFRPLQMAWERYWATVSPWHSRLMDTFHNGGDWDALKTECLNADVPGMISGHLRGLRMALFDAEATCKHMPAENNTDKAALLFSALLLLVSSGEAEEQSHGPSRWREVSLTLNGNQDANVAELASKSPCIANANVASAASTASTLGFTSVPSDTSVEATTLGIKKPSRVAASSGLTSANSHSHDRRAEDIPQGCLQQRTHLGDDMMVRLSHLRDRVDWLAREMARIGEPGGGLSLQSASSTSPAAFATQERMVLA